MLGWGGYWGWDPVENAIVLPWLTGTAYIHSVMVQERRGMLRVWNISLLVATFALTILGTFLTRRRRGSPACTRSATAGSGRGCSASSAKADAQRGRRDASRLLADASLAAQRVVGVDTRPVLAEPTEDGLIAAVEDATFVVAGISPRWRSEGSARPAGRSYGGPTRRCCSSTAG